eukprot:1955590-Amphidinium_carterae.1
MARQDKLDEQQVEQPSKPSHCQFLIRIVTNQSVAILAQVSHPIPVKKKRISTFHQSMNRVRVHGLPAHVNAKSRNLFTVLGSMEPNRARNV